MPQAALTLIPVASCDSVHGKARPSRIQVAHMMGASGTVGGSDHVDLHHDHIACALRIYDLSGRFGRDGGSREVNFVSDGSRNKRFLIDLRAERTVVLMSKASLDTLAAPKCTWMTPQGRQDGRLARRLPDSSAPRLLYEEARVKACFLGLIPIQSPFRDARSRRI